MSDHDKNTDNNKNKHKNELNEINKKNSMTSKKQNNTENINKSVLKIKEELKVNEQNKNIDNEDNLFITKIDFIDDKNLLNTRASNLMNKINNKNSKNLLPSIVNTNSIEFKKENELPNLKIKQEGNSKNEGNINNNINDDNNESNNKNNLKTKPYLNIPTVSLSATAKLSGELQLQPFTNPFIFPLFTSHNSQY